MQFITGKTILRLSHVEFQKKSKGGGGGGGGRKRALNSKRSSESSKLLEIKKRKFSIIRNLRFYLRNFQLSKIELKDQVNILIGQRILT